MNLSDLAKKLREFAEERDWEQFHSPKNLSMALSVEVAELVEHFQWLTQEQSKSLNADDLSDDEEFIRIGLTDESSKLNLNTATEWQLLVLAAVQKTQRMPQFMTNEYV